MCNICPRGLGPTAAQRRYGTRTDLGNTPELDGDGILFRGWTGIQITGRANTVLFREWCRGRFAQAPDFEADPDVMLSDPWEGLGPGWYWGYARLNRYADENDPEMITRRINGGLNGYPDRLRWYARAALVLLGYAPGAVREFQRASNLTIRGVSGPRTRAALHSALRQRPELGGGAHAVVSVHSGRSASCGGRSGPHQSRDLCLRGSLIHAERHP